MRAILSLGNVHRSTGKLQIPVSTISALAAFGAFVAFWAPAYLKILENSWRGTIRNSWVAAVRCRCHWLGQRCLPCPARYA